jgi:hypothetical protein
VKNPSTIDNLDSRLVSLASNPATFAIAAPSASVIKRSVPFLSTLLSTAVVINAMFDSLARTFAPYELTVSLN